MFSVIMVWIVTVGFGGWFFISRLRKFEKWRKASPITTRQQILWIVLPTVLAGTIFVPALTDVPQEMPIPQEELLQITAPVKHVREYTSRHAQVRGGVHIVKRYRIYLEGDTSTLYIPDYFRFDQDAFLRWAGPDPVTFCYARTGSNWIPYQIEIPDRGIFLDYQWTYPQLLYNTLKNLGITLLFLILALGGAVYLPAYLYPWKKEDRRGNRRDLLVIVLFGVPLLVISRFAAQPTITDTPADTSDPITVELREDIQLTLPRGWVESSETNTQWYQTNQKVSTCFRLTECLCDVPEAQWCAVHLSDYRAYLLETFIKKPQDDFGPFLTELACSSDDIPHTEYVVSAGAGKSTNNYKDHFLVVFLPEVRCMLTIQSSSKNISWDGLAEYVEQSIWPLLYGLEVKR